jgi:hypothetical protein
MLQGLFNNITSRTTVAHSFVLCDGRQPLSSRDSRVLFEYAAVTVRFRTVAGSVSLQLLDTRHIYQIVCLLHVEVLVVKMTTPRRECSLPHSFHCEKYLDIKFNANPSSASRGAHEETDGQTERHDDANSRYSQFCETA